MTTCHSPCVPDASVLIDFRHSGLLEVLLSLPYRWLMPDLTLAELHDPDPQVILRLGVERATFDGREILAIMNLWSRYPGLSLPDCTGLFLAQRERALLLTGDRLLQRIANHHFGLTVHGTLWVLDRLLAECLLTPTEVAHALRAMLQAGSRLPRAECERRLERWERDWTKSNNMIPNDHLKALAVIVDRLRDRAIAWVVTGSLGMALQGVPAQVHDIDIQTDEDGAYEIERCLAAYVVKPVRYSESERIRSHFGALEVDGIKVEIMGGVQKRLNDLDWEEPVRVEDHRHWITVDRMRVPVLSLEYEYQAYLKLGRVERAEMLRSWLRKTGDG